MELMLHQCKAKADSVVAAATAQHKRVVALGAFQKRLEPLPEKVGWYEMDSRRGFGKGLGPAGGVLRADWE